MHYQNIVHSCRIPAMFQSLLSVLFMGMVPAASLLHEPVSSLQIPIAPPSEIALHIGQRLSASGVLVLDANSGEALFAKQSEVRRPMASLTKLMTAILIVENHDIDEIVTIPAWANQVEGNVAYLPPGERFRVGDLLSALLIASANDAARVLAVYHAGSEADFAVQMNERAAELGLQSTSFANASGLDHPNQYSTPKDMAWLTTYALRQEPIAMRMHKRGLRIWSLEGNILQLYHTHSLLHANSAVMAGKTGTTTAAGQCLISLVEKGNKSYIVVLMNSLHRYTDMQTILDTLVPATPIVAELSR